MDRLRLFKTLGDNTRYAIYLELARASTPRSTADVAEALDLHPNTVRPHLERMRDVGLLEVSVDGRGSVGRPQHRYSVAPDAPSLGLEPPAFPLMAGLLANVAAACGPDADAVASVGRAHGRHAGATRAAATADCLGAVRAELRELGFDPVEDSDGGVTTIAFSHCPYLQLAEAFPELVCHLHRGVVEGMVEVLGGVRIERFATLADRDPCHVALTSR
ncbi:MAG TPA: helix-turn-helix domain-containing protein [Acidimicrobiales bacterium]|nr:helix-turn-helix domain-containing protein [Acidimicrobiales bacterium]